MTAVRIVAVCSLMFLGLQPQGIQQQGWCQEQQKADPRETVEGAVAEATRLLKAKKYPQLLKNLVAPKHLEAVLKDSTMEEFAQAFGEDKADKLLAALEDIKDKQPEMSNDGKTATFQVSKEISSRELRFEKVGSYWYIKN